MAEALLLGVMTSVMQEAVMKLCSRLRGLKGTDAESRELQEFIDLLEGNSSLCISSEVVRQELRKSLDEAKSKLEKWSSQKSGFLARSSSERTQELQAQRRSVENAIRVANLRLADDANGKLDILIKHNSDSEFGWTQNPAQNPSQNPAQDPTQDSAHNLPLEVETFHKREEINYQMAISHHMEGDKISDEMTMSLQMTTDQIDDDMADSHQMEGDQIINDMADSHQMQMEGDQIIDDMAIFNKEKRNKAMGRGRRAFNRLQDPFQRIRNGHQPNTPTNMASNGNGENVSKWSADFAATTVRVTRKLTGPATYSTTTLNPSGGSDQAHSTGQQQPCTSTHGGHKRPASSLEESSITSPPSSAATAESVLEIDKLTSPDRKKWKVHAWRELRVSIGTKKQAKDIKERLFGLKGVKEVHIDQSSQKVLVLLHEGSNVKTTTLLENAQLK